ncbi:MAG: hypothetical protein JWO03_1050 [Bacteroidetes bacterium]|nr:hypothetical protein [Bacteroidota bacterium]
MKTKRLILLLGVLVTITSVGQDTQPKFTAPAVTFSQSFEASFTVSPGDWGNIVQKGNAEFRLSYTYDVKPGTSEFLREKGILTVYLYDLKQHAFVPLPYSYLMSGVELKATYEYKNGYVVLHIDIKNNTREPILDPIQYKIVFR